MLGADRDEPGRRERLLEVGKYVVALDVHSAVMNENGHEPARVDAEVPRIDVAVCQQVDVVRLPLQAFQVEEDAQLLRA